MPHVTLQLWIYTNEHHRKLYKRNKNIAWDYTSITVVELSIMKV